MYKIWGKVREYNKRGRELGFPTANINLTKKIPEGVYVSKLKLGKTFFNALTFIGIARTFDEEKFIAETYVLDFKENIYGKWISVGLLKKIRGNRKFNSAGELVEQMKKDREQAINYFNNSPLD